jgi:hypothetical protein
MLMDLCNSFSHVFVRERERDDKERIFLFTSSAREDETVKRD